MPFRFAAIVLIVLAAAPAFAHEGAQVLAKSEKSWDGATLPNYPTEQPQVTVLKVTVPPKTKLPWHKHDVINAGYLIKGELTVVSEDGKQLKLKPGDVLIELVDTWHYGRNDGDEPAEIVVFYAGTKNEAITVLKEPHGHEHHDEGKSKETEK